MAKLTDPRQPGRRSQSTRLPLVARIGTAIIVLLVIASGVYLSQRSSGNKSELPSVGSTPTSTSTTIVASAGGTLVEGDVGLPSTLDPLLATSQTEHDLAKLMFDGLVRVDGSGTPQPDLAEKWTVSPDGLTYTFTLRPNVTWQDGSPFTSQDVRFTIGLIQSANFPGNEQMTQFWRPILVETPNNQTVTFHLLEPFSPFLNFLDLPILPKHILGGTVPEDLTTDAFNVSPVGTGPYSLDSFDKAHAEVKLRAFRNYWGTKPNLDNITIRYFDDANALVSALKSGEVQATGSLSTAEILQPGFLPPQDVVYGPLMMSYTALFLNTRVEPFSNQIVRQAIQMAIDPSELTNGPLKSEAMAGSSPIPASSWAYVESHVTPDQQRATSLLDKAGWKYVEKDGVLENGGARLSFKLLVNSDDPQRVLMAQTIARQLSQIHVQVDVEPASTADVSQALTSRTFTAAIFGGHYGHGDPDCLDAWDSSGTTSGLNFTGINDDVIDQSLKDARSTTDLASRKQDYAKFQQAFVTQAPAIVLYYPRFLYVVSSSIGGVTPDPIINPSDRFNHIASWYLRTQPSASATP